MAKKDKKDKKKSGNKDKAAAGAVEAVDAVRAAVERTFTATAEGAQSLRGPAQGLAGELADAANRIREVLEDRVLHELKGLRADVEGLARRVSALEVNPRAAAPRHAARRRRSRPPRGARRRAPARRRRSRPRRAPRRRGAAPRRRSR